MKLSHTLVASTLGLLIGCGSGTPTKETKNTEKSKAPEQKTEAVAQKDNNLPTYKIATVDTYPPFATADEFGVVTGFDIDVIRAIAKEKKFNAEFVVHPWEDWKTDLLNNRVDIWAAGITIKDARKEAALYSDSYMQYQTAILARDDEKSKNLSEATLQNYVLGAEKKSTSLNIAKTLNPNPEKVIGFDSNYSAFASLQQKKIDAVIGNSIVLANLTIDFPEFKFKLLPLSPKITERKELGFILQKDHTKLAAEINDGLAAIKASGEFKKIKKKWFGDLDI